MDGWHLALQRECLRYAVDAGMVDTAAGSLLRVLLDFTSPHPHPWYAIAKLPVLGSAWDVRSSTQAILTVNRVPVRLFTVGPVAGMCFYTALADDAARSRITIKLMRPQDRAALAGMHNRARWGEPEVPAVPVERFTAIAVHEHDQVCATARELHAL